MLRNLSSWRHLPTERTSRLPKLERLRVWLELAIPPAMPAFGDCFMRLICYLRPRFLGGGLPRSTFRFLRTWRGTEPALRRFSKIRRVRNIAPLKINRNIFFIVYLLLACDLSGANST
jgi:hypothetical protein